MKLRIADKSYRNLYFIPYDNLPKTALHPDGKPNLISLFRQSYLGVGGYATDPKKCPCYIIDIYRGSSSSGTQYLFYLTNTGIVGSVSYDMYMNPVYPGHPNKHGDCVIVYRDTDKPLCNGLIYAIKTSESPVLTPRPMMPTIERVFPPLSSVPLFNPDEFYQSDYGLYVGLENLANYRKINDALRMEDGVRGKGERRRATRRRLRRQGKK